MDIAYGSARLMLCHRPQLQRPMAWVCLVQGVLTAWLPGYLLMNEMLA